MNADRLVERTQANVAAFLLMIRACEGTAGPDGYRTLFGGDLFGSYAQHPNILKPFRQTDGTTSYTTAAGAYQFLWRTWADLQMRLRLDDFGPRSQDRAAELLISDCRAMEDVASGRLMEAVDKTSRIWASLPASRYLQPRRSIQFAANAFAEAGGVLA